jgi:hypothetical protein
MGPVKAALVGAKTVASSRMPAASKEKTRDKRVVRVRAQVGHEVEPYWHT